MNSMQRKACEQIKANGSQTVDEFVKIHTPFGHEIWTSLLNDRYVYIDMADHVQLTLVGTNALLVLR